MARIGLLSITRNCVNRGNLIIEHATRRAVGVDEFSMELDAHAAIDDDQLERTRDLDLMVLPGATLLEPEDHAAAPGLARLRCSTLALGVALRSRDLGARLDVARWIHGDGAGSPGGRSPLPIGARDPFTHEALRAAGIESDLVGCQTFLLGVAERWTHRQGPIVFAPGLGYQPPMAACALACAQMGPTTLLLHAPERQPAMVAHTNLTVRPLESALGAFETIRSASVVVTGRIHACLVCLVLGVPFIFLGPWYDSRYSLLDHLEIPLEPPVPQRIERLVRRMQDGAAPADVCLERVARLRERMTAFLGRAGAPFGIAPVLGKLRGREQA
jgi:hypothetical protein